jgi:hypothetical protein
MGIYRRRLAGRARQAGFQKATPSGSKFRVPAAPITGPLKSPALKKDTERLFQDDFVILGKWFRRRAGIVSSELAPAI